MDTEACYDASGDGEHCICGYNPPNGDVGCCTGTLQVDMGGGITGNFDYVGWDAQYNKPYYRTKACLRFEIHDLDSRNSEKYLNEFSRFCQYGLQEQRF